MNPIHLERHFIPPAPWHLFLHGLFTWSCLEPAVITFGKFLGPSSRASQKIDIEEIVGSCHPLPIICFFFGTLFL